MVLNLKSIFLLMIVLAPASTAAVLNNDLEHISQSVHQWKMSFNPEPRKQAVIFQQEDQNCTSISLFQWNICQ